MRLILAACHRGLAAIVVTHDAQLASWADRVVFLRDGRIVDQTLPIENPRPFLARRPEPMSVGVLERPTTGSASEAKSGGVPARRAMVRWSWRLFLREWRQQLLILLLIVVAVAAVVVGAAVAVNTPPPANAGYRHGPRPGDLHKHPGRRRGRRPQSAFVDAQIAALEHRFGRSRSSRTRPSASPAATRRTSSAPRTRTGPMAEPMIQLLSGHYPTGPDQIAVTPGRGVRAEPHGRRHLATGGKTVVGMVQNPQSLLDEFALVVPGQVTHPTEVNVLFDAPAVDAGQGSALQRHDGRFAQRQPINPYDHRAGVGDRRHAADRPGVDRWLHRAGPAPHALPRDAASPWGRPTATCGSSWRRTASSSASWVPSLGFVLGLVLWLAYRPHNEQSAHHVIGDVRAALERDRAGHGAGGRRDVLRRRLSRPGP